jgi:hypothetical protein
MLSRKQADGEGMAFDLGLRDGRLNCPEDKNGLTRGTHIEAVIRNPSVRGQGSVAKGQWLELGG